MITTLAGVLCGMLAASAQDAPGRAPEPSAAAQKETLSAVREIFKEQYARPDKAALARTLLEKARESSEGSTDRYVLLRQAAELAAGAGQADTAVTALDQLSASFALRGFDLKLDTLALLAKSARDPETIRATAKGYLGTAKEAVVSEDFGAATTAASKASALAKACRDAFLAARTQELEKDIPSIKSEHGRVKPFLDEKGGSATEEVGRYLCFVRGDWNGGLPILAGQGKSPLKELAGRDLEGPAEVAKQTAVGDGWWEQASKEKSLWRKGRLLDRARHWYDQAYEASAGLDRIRISKRLDEIDAAVPGPVNLLRLVDPTRDTVNGTWAWEGAELVSSGSAALALTLPYHPPEEYDLRVVARRIAGADALNVGLVVGGFQVMAVFDALPGSGYLTGLERVDGRGLDLFPGLVKGKQLEGQDRHVLEFAVRRDSVHVKVNGKSCYRWSGNPSVLSIQDGYKGKDSKALSLAAWGNKNAWIEAKLTPLSGPGKKAR